MFKHCMKMTLQAFRKGVQCSYGRYVKGVPFFNKMYIKRGTFSAKMVYKRVRGWTSGRSLPVLGLQHYKFNFSYSFKKAIQEIEIDFKKIIK